MGTLPDSETCAYPIVRSAPAKAELPTPTPNKYKAVKTGKYASKKEAARAAELALLARAGAIIDLFEQVRFELVPAQYVDGKCVERSVVYCCDFSYYRNGVRVVEDVKGMRTPAYIIKRKLFRQKFGYGITEL